MKRTRIPDGIALGAGLWLLVSPGLMGLGQTHALAPHNVFVGLVVALLGAGRLWWHQGAWAAWSNAVLASWIVFSPYILAAQHGGFTASNVVTGLVLAVASVWSALVAPDFISGPTFAAAEPTERERRERLAREPSPFDDRS